MHDLIIVGAGGPGWELAQFAREAAAHGAPLRLKGFLEHDPTRRPPPHAELPILGNTTSTRSARPIAPRNHIEQLLVDLSSEVLGVERVGIDDDFTILGGDSLSAVELFFKIQQQFQVGFSLSCFFKRPTVAAFAQELESILARSTPGTAPRDETVSTNGP